MVKRHDTLKKMVGEYLTSIGYENIEFERRFNIPGKNSKTFVVDVYGERKLEKNIYKHAKETVVVECGHVEHKKLLILSMLFDKVIVWSDNVDFQGNDYTQKITELSREITKLRKDLRLTNHTMNELKRKKRSQQHTLQRNQQKYSALILSILARMSRENYDGHVYNRLLQDKETLEKYIPRLIDCFDLACKIYQINRIKHMHVENEVWKKLEDVKDKINILKPELKKYSVIEDWFV